MLSVLNDLSSSIFLVAKVPCNLTSCQHICFQSDTGEKKCTCHKGYQLSGNGYNCTGVDISLIVCFVWWVAIRSTQNFLNRRTEVYSHTNCDFVLATHNVLLYPVRYRRVLARNKPLQPEVREYTWRLPLSVQWWLYAWWWLGDLFWYGYYANLLFNIIKLWQGKDKITK